jgi:hypothetical protein
MNIKTKSITSFISSANRQSTEDVYNFTIDFQDGVLTCNNNEFMEINVLSFDMPNNMYNIDSNNNQFQIKDGENYINKTIPAGNYNVKTFLKILQEIITEHIIVKYNEAQNTYTFQADTTQTGITDASYKFKSINIGGLLNISNDIEYDITQAGFTTGLVNLVNFNKVMVKTKNISYYYSNLQNLTTNKQVLNDVIFWKSKTDVEPYAILKYNNEDGGNSFNYKIEDRQINSIIFELKNERDEFITNAPEFLMVIQFNFYEKQNYLNLLKNIERTLFDMYNSILFAMQRMRLLL